MSVRLSAKTTRPQAGGSAWLPAFVLSLVVVALTCSAAAQAPESKCAIGGALMTEPGRAEEGLALCKAAAEAGDVDAQMAVGDAYFHGLAGKRDLAEARKWYAKAAKQNKPDAARRLGEMYARGEGGRKDMKKAMEYWSTAEKAGDPLVSILVADQLFSQLTGGRSPGPGVYAFKGGIPLADIEVVEEWYRQAVESDPRPDVQARAKSALSTLESFKTAAKSPAAKP